MTAILSDLPGHARLWVYASSQPLTPDASRALAGALRRFTDGWTSHGRAVHAAFDVREGRLIILAGLVPQSGDVSGCGIDASVRAVEDAAAAAGIALAGALDVVYRDSSGRIEVASRPDFKRMARAGEVGPDTTVFDLSATTLADLREGRVERPAAESWHARLLPATA
jgi:hypothetical protein